MAANDITISVAAGGQSVDVTRMMRPAKDRVETIAETTNIAANANATLNIGPGETFVIERSDRQQDTLAAHPAAVTKGHQRK